MLQGEPLLGKHSSHSATFIMLKDLSRELSHRTGCLFLRLLRQEINSENSESSTSSFIFMMADVMHLPLRKTEMRLMLQCEVWDVFLSGAYATQTWVHYYSILMVHSVLTFIDSSGVIVKLNPDAPVKETDIIFND